MALVFGAAVRLLAVVALAFAGLTEAATDFEEDSPWYSVDENGDAQVHLFFAWSSTCPHCTKAKPFVANLESDYPWLEVHRLQVNQPGSGDLDRAVTLTESIGGTFQSVPTFLYCETMTVGFTSPDTTGAHIQSALEACHAAAQADVTEGYGDRPPPDKDDLSLPIVGDVDPETVSLPAFTVALASLDAFNPCAFFVLLFLLSLLVHARSRRRMAMIGGTFVLFSGLVYFAFMVAWLNVFLLFGALPAVTIAAGAVAVLIALINIKDHFWTEKGPSLSIPEGAKPGLFKRMRSLTTSRSLPLMMAGTVTLAVVANSYELLCTAGFPLVFTRVLTLNELPTVTYYSYLVLYNVVYVLPLLVIVAVFVWTLGSRKLSARAGRALKLVSGLMMLGLGLVLLFASDLLGNLLTAPIILAGAVVTTGVVLLVERVRRGGKPDLVERRPIGAHQSR